MSEAMQAWVGRTQSQDDMIDPVRTGALLTALGRPAEVRSGDGLGPLHHWLYFWEPQPPDALGPDGHPQGGGFLPPTPGARRMWAGGRVEFHRPLRVGDRASRVSTIKAVQRKSGRTGELVFVTILHEISGPEGLAIVEEQDLVYRPPPPTASPAPPSEPQTPSPADWRETVRADPVLLFRYSALTLNGHRIHYDQPYATGVEGYPGLVVHGPLQATLLASLGARQLQTEPRLFEYRGQSPAWDIAPLCVCGERAPDGARLWTEQDGRVCMTALFIA